MEKERNETTVSVNGKHNIVNCRRETPYTAVQKDAIEIANDVVNYMVSDGTSSKILKSSNKYSTVMSRAVGEISHGHELLFKGMSEKLGITETNVADVLPVVLDEVFADGKYNWGRLVTVYAFAGWVARHLALNNKNFDHTTTVSRIAGVYVATKLASWIESNGGWDGFEVFFVKPESVERMILGALICTVVSVGIGVLATALIVK